MEQVTQIEPYLNLLEYIIRADGVVEEEERRGLAELLALRLPTPLEHNEREALFARIDAGGPAEPTDQELIQAGDGIDTHTLCHLVRDAYALAASDGQIHESEVKTMRRYLRLLGIPTERFADIDLWARGKKENLNLGKDLLSPRRP